MSKTVVFICVTRYLKWLEIIREFSECNGGVFFCFRELDDGLKEAVSSIIWVSLRLHSDCAELKLISDMLTAKYGKPYAMSCMDDSVGTVSPKLMQKMSVQAPPKILVERYLIEIAKNYNVDYEPDEKVLAILLLLFLLTYVVKMFLLMIYYVAL